MQDRDEVQVVAKPAHGDALETDPQVQTGAACKQSVTAYRLRRVRFGRP